MGQEEEGRKTIWPYPSMPVPKLYSYSLCCTLRCLVAALSKAHNTSPVIVSSILLVYSLLVSCIVCFVFCYFAFLSASCWPAICLYSPPTLPVAFLICLHLLHAFNISSIFIMHFCVWHCACVWEGTAAGREEQGQTLACNLPVCPMPNHDFTCTFCHAPCGTSSLHRQERLDILKVC